MFLALVTPRRRRLGIIITGLLVASTATFYLVHNSSRSGVLIHGKGPPGQLYPLVPFPESPQESSVETSSDASTKAPWMAAVICAAWDTEIRMVIRSTWMRLARDLPLHTRFVVSNPGPEWTETVAFENRTFGDMIVLDHLQEDDYTANTVKTLEFYKWLRQRGPTYEFVTKVDTDTWVNGRGFWDRYLEPRLTDGKEPRRRTVENTIIGQMYYPMRGGLPFPQGAMYTVTWDLLERLVDLQEQHHVITDEDHVPGELLTLGEHVVDFVNFQGTEKFDYDDRDSRGDGTAWAREQTHPDYVRHALGGNEAIAIHELKKKKDWFKVAACFDEQGIKDVPPRTQPDPWPPISQGWLDFWETTGLVNVYKSNIDRIPEHYWTLDGDNWICNAVWNMGRTRDGSSFQLELLDGR